jgi:hypothetical protein
MVNARAFSCLLALAAAAVAPSINAASSAWQSYQGEARDPENGTLLYVEQHFQRFDADRLSERVVAYLCPSGEGMFARKRVDYTRSLTAPAFDLRDARSDYREGMVRQADDRVALFAGELDADPVLSFESAPADLVADAGFDEFVRQNWSSLTQGRSVSLRFGLPSRAASYRFQLVPDGETTWDDRPALALKLRLSGVLGWFAPDIRVLYDLEQKRLVHYQGLSNLRDAAGTQLQAQIAFPQSPVSAPSGAVEAVLDTPLVACRSESALSTADRATEKASGSEHPNRET